MTSGLGPERVQQVLKQLQVSQSGLQRALAQHRLAPPDAGFGRRLRDFGDACDDFAVAAQNGADARFSFDPPAGDERPVRLPVPHELAPDSGRPGPPDLWEAFDEAVEDVNEAFAGISYARISRAFARLAQAALDLADEIEQERRLSEREASAPPAAG